MNCGCVSEPNRVSNMTDEGMGFTPPIPVKVVEHIGPSGREMSDTKYQAVDTKIPNVVFGESTVLLDTTTLDFSKDGGNDWYVSSAIQISKGDLSQESSIYNIIWDGVEYECFFVYEFYKKANGTGFYDCVVVGNSEVLGYSKKYETAAPFAVINGRNQSNRNKTYVYTTSDAAKHTIKISVTPYTREIVNQRFYANIDAFGAAMQPLFDKAKGYTLVGASLANEGALASGNGSQAKGLYSVALGLTNIANGQACFAEGSVTVAGENSSVFAAHSEGGSTQALATYSHAEGQKTTASGVVSHAEGSDTIASGSRAHTEGDGTIANHRAQHAFGQWNVADTSEEVATNRGNYVEIVGNGTADNARSNARTLDWSGNEVLSGSLTLGKGTEDEVTVTAAQLKALLATLT